MVADDDSCGMLKGSSSCSITSCCCCRRRLLLRPSSPSSSSSSSSSPPSIISLASALPAIPPPPRHRASPPVLRDFGVHVARPGLFRGRYGTAAASSGRSPNTSRRSIRSRPRGSLWGYVVAEEFRPSRCVRSGMAMLGIWNCLVGRAGFEGLVWG